MTTRELINTRIEGMEDLEDIINTVEFTVREQIVKEIESLYQGKTLFITCETDCPKLGECNQHPFVVKGDEVSLREVLDKIKL